MLTRLAAAALSAVAAVSFAACSSPDKDSAGGACPTGAAPSDTPSAFDGDVKTEKIMVGPQEVTVPEGLKLPDGAIVTDAQELSVMISDEDPAAVIDAVTESAKASGYEMCDKPSDEVYLWVGHGNVVQLLAIPGAQQLIWGPESMKYVLAKPMS